MSLLLGLYLREELLSHMAWLELWSVNSRSCLSIKRTFTGSIMEVSRIHKERLRDGPGNGQKLQNAQWPGSAVDGEEPSLATISTLMTGRLTRTAAVLRPSTPRPRAPANGDQSFPSSPSWVLLASFLLASLCSLLFPHIFRDALGP